MVDDKELRFKEGDKVIIYKDGFGRYVGICTVFKVYKTGNFILRKNGDQYKQCGNPAGVYSYDMSMVVPYDDEFYEKKVKPIRIRKKWHKLDRVIESRSLSEKALDAIIKLLEE